jgi:hypothetical protein
MRARSPWCESRKILHGLSTNVIASDRGTNPIAVPGQVVAGDLRLITVGALQGGKDRALERAPGSCRLDLTTSRILYQPVLSIPEDTPDIESSKTLSTSSLSGESALRARSRRSSATWMYESGST